MTVEELMSLLEDQEPNAEVRFASQPSWPFEYSISEIVGPEDQDPRDLDEEELEENQEQENVVYLAEGHQIGYLPGLVSRALGWR